jgi:hypothetical protein
VDLREPRTLLGHAHPETTARYTHLTEVTAAQARERPGRLLSPSSCAGGMPPDPPGRDHQDLPAGSGADVTQTAPLAPAAGHCHPRGALGWNQAFSTQSQLKSAGSSPIRRLTRCLSHHHPLGSPPGGWSAKKIFPITGPLPTPRARPTIRTSRGSLCSHELSLLVRLC